MSEYIIWESDKTETIDYLGVKHSISHFEKREEIVRCRDCKYMRRVKHWLGMDIDECWLHADRESGALGKERTEPDGFCAWGERRKS